MNFLTKEDFFKKYSDNRLITLTFAHDNLDITIKDSWEINREIQKYVLHSNNCYFISLDYTKMAIRIDNKNEETNTN